VFESYNTPVHLHRENLHKECNENKPTEAAWLIMCVTLLSLKLAKLYTLNNSFHSRYTTMSKLGTIHSTIVRLIRCVTLNIAKLILLVLRLEINYTSETKKVKIEVRILMREVELAHTVPTDILVGF